MSRKIIYLSGIAILSVVINHATEQGFIALFWWTDRYLPGASVPNFSQIGGFQYYILLIFATLTQFSVPIFLFTTGFFLAYASTNKSKDRVWKVVQPRIKTLLFPYLFWSLFILGLQVVESCLHGQCQFLSIGRILFKLLTGKSQSSYWYVIVLVQMYLISPLLLTYIKNHWKSALIFFIAIQLFLELAVYYFLIISPTTWDTVYPAARRVFLFSFFYFVLGVAFAYNLQLWRNQFHRWRRVLALTIIVTGILAILSNDFTYRINHRLSPNPIFMNGFTISLILYFFLHANFRLPAFRLMQKLSCKSYGIYLIHFSLVQYSARFFYHILPKLLDYQMIFQPVLIFLGVGIPMALMSITGKAKVGSIYQYVFG
jgi:surface polysaccharide O-acyltransferase-like enzyme